MRLNVASIQHFSVGDGDGIRTTVFLKGCNLHCPWCHNPETISAESVKLPYATGTVTSGTWMTLDAVMREIMEDAVFYGDSGGVTVSGGEPMLQADGAAELLRLCRDAGISTVIDTAGCVPYASFVLLRGLVDTYYFDLKACDALGYGAIGGDFEQVCGNLSRLIADGEHVRVRIPLIPGFNDAPDYCRRMCEALRKVGAAEVDLLPFHRLGSGKYDALGLPYAYRDTPMMLREKAEQIAAIYKRDFHVRIDG